MDVQMRHALADAVVLQDERPIRAEHIRHRPGHLPHGQHDVRGHGVIRLCQGLDVRSWHDQQVADREGTDIQERDRSGVLAHTVRGAPARDDLAEEASALRDD